MNRLALFSPRGDGLGLKTRHFRKTSLCISSRKDFWKKGVKPVIPVTCELPEVSKAHSYIDTSIKRRWAAHRGSDLAAPIVDHNVRDAVRGDQILRLRDSLFLFEGVTLAEKTIVQMSAPDEAVAQIRDLTCRLGDPHRQRPCHRRPPFLLVWDMSITALCAGESKHIVMVAGGAEEVLP